MCSEGTSTDDYDISRMTRTTDKAYVNKGKTPALAKHRGESNKLLRDGKGRKKQYSLKGLDLWEEMTLDPSLEKFPNRGGVRKEIEHPREPHTGIPNQCRGHRHKTTSATKESSDYAGP